MDDPGATAEQPDQGSNEGPDERAPSRRSKMPWLWLALVVAVVLVVTVVGGVVALRPSSDPLVGDWDVTYGAPAIVTIAKSGDGYTVTAKTPVRVVHATCDLPSGTSLATFSAAGPDHEGQHGLWWTNDCAFARWAPGTFTLDGRTLEARFTNGQSVTFTKR
jgi:hypothetical protein